MQTRKIKIIFSLIIFALISLLGMTVYASNENIQVIKKSETDYLIYIKNNLNDSFEFAFSNDSSADKTTLTYLSAAQDSSEGENYIAYINQYTTANKYIWAKKSDEYILEGIELDLTKAIPEDELTQIQKVTKIIPVDTTKTNTTEETVDGKKVTVTTGKVVMNEEGDYKYQIIKLPSTDNNNKLMNLANRISKFNTSTDMYTKLEVYKEFNELYNNVVAGLADADWKNVENKEILQPEDTEDGDEYILFIRNQANGTIVTDAQFLTSKKVYSEEKIVEKITTKLPVTYDNNTLLIVLAIVVLATVIVSVRIKSLENKDNK